MSKVIQNTRRVCINLFQSNWNVDIVNSILLFTHGRGGGTWLQESLATELNLPMIFEPFSGPDFASLEKEAYSEIHTTDLNDKESIIQYFNQVLSGHYLHGQHVFQNPFFLNKKSPAVIKLVNRTELIPMMYQHFKTERPFVYLFRDPIRVLTSRISYGKVMLTEVRHSWSEEDLAKLFAYLPPEQIPWSKLKTNYELDVFKVYAHQYLVQKKLKDYPVVYLDYDQLKSKEENASKQALKDKFGVNGLLTVNSSSSRKSFQKRENKQIDADLLSRLEYIQEFMNQLT